MVTVALDVEPAHTYQWIDAAAPTHPSLIDTTHVTGELFGFVNIPMAVWIDETGTLVRPAEGASVVRSPLRDMEIPEGLPERIDRMFREVKKIPDDAEAYRAATAAIRAEVGRGLVVQITSEAAGRYQAAEQMAVVLAAVPATAAVRRCNSSSSMGSAASICANSGSTAASGHIAVKKSSAASYSFSSPAAPAATPITGCSAASGTTATTSA